MLQQLLKRKENQLNRNKAKLDQSKLLHPSKVQYLSKIKQLILRELDKVRVNQTKSKRIKNLKFLIKCLLI